MAQYKCKNSFQSINNGYFGYGQRIGQNEYGNLSYSEQRNFAKEEESHSDNNYNSQPSHTPTITDFGSPSSSADSGTSFGGGDFGGGGASGSW